MTIDRKDQSPEVDDPGFLPHEAALVLAGLVSATGNLREANLNYGDAVSGSGGDWAFDDPTSRDAALVAHQIELDVRKLHRLKELLEDNGTIPYPNDDNELVTYGSIVTTREDDGFEMTNQIATRVINGQLPVPGAESITQPDSSLGEALIGSKVGDIVEWVGGQEDIFEAKVVSVDQSTVKDHYAELIGNEVKNEEHDE